MNIIERTFNYVYVTLNTETGCDPQMGEYTLFITASLGGLDISSPGGVDDVSLIRECVENDIDFTKLPEDGFAEIILKESGEREDMFWHKYYVVESVSMVDR